ncbi:hypothetical protein HDU96_004758 [Phlyctochytrium bullatum]|nr:hypothetical protein HDU96_004758 [Phlyctochytrium bullatum]
MFEGDLDAGLDVKKLHSMGKKAVCYINAGSIEESNFRTDSSQFPPSDVGDYYDGWPERFLNIRSSAVRRIIAARIQRAADAGCDGIEADNVDLYLRHTGFDFKREDSRDYFVWLANEAHARNMAIGLKNSVELAEIYPEVMASADFVISESCYVENMCGRYGLFVSKGKPVFDLEYVDAGSTGGCSRYVLSRDRIPAAKSDLASRNIDGLIKECGLKESYDPVLRYEGDGFRDPSKVPAEISNVLDGNAVAKASFVQKAVKASSAQKGSVSGMTCAVALTFAGLALIQ